MTIKYCINCNKNSLYEAADGVQERPRKAQRAYNKQCINLDELLCEGRSSSMRQVSLVREVKRIWVGSLESLGYNLYGLTTKRDTSSHCTLNIEFQTKSSYSLSTNSVQSLSYNYLYSPATLTKSKHSGILSTFILDLGCPQQDTLRPRTGIQQGPDGP